jgi:hypothetical protein
MRWIWTALPAVLSLCVSVRAQAVSSVVVTQDLVVTSSTTGTWTFPAGPVPQAGLSLTTQGQNSCWSRIDLSPDGGLAPPPPGGTGWWLDGTIHISLSPPGGYAAVSLTGSVILSFSSPQPVNGVLYLRPYFRLLGFNSFSGDATVDVDLDGIPDYSASTQYPQDVNIPLTLDANGRSLAIAFSFNGSVSQWSINGVSGEAGAYWDILFIPNTYALEPYATGCVPLTFARDPYSSYSLGIASTATSQSQVPIGPGLFLLGLGPQNTPLPFQPFCPLLVTNLTLVPPDAFAAYGIGFHPPDLPIPPGLQFYCQAVFLDAQGNVLTSDSIRTM